MGEAAVGRRTMRAAGAMGLALALALSVWTSTASAEPLSMTFTEDRANVGVQLTDTALFEAPDVAPLEAQIGPAGESITAGVLQVPQFSTHITEPIVADVTVDFDIGVITGSFTQATGALTLSGQAGGTLTSDGEDECTVSTTPSPLILSTAGNNGGTSPRSGAPFTHGLTGTGAIAGQWTDMQATPVSPGDTENVDFCNNVETRIGGPGGIWLVQAGDVAPPSAPRLTSTDPASPNPSGTPRIRGAAEAGSTVRVYAGSNCAGAPLATASAAELGSPGIRVEVGEGVTAAFSATATDAAGNTSACSASISYTRPPHGDPPAPGCIVPKLVGKKLKAAKARIRAAGCKLGTVQKPSQPKGKGKGRRALVVKSSNPAAGTRSASGNVDLTLGPKPRKARH
ncbi:MAG TPA: PASTA domain-containing protein [Solirubrobacterales bacterium]|nr:PASTA domain-containing protein [Solirubrobacterales bacterium]